MELTKQQLIHIGQMMNHLSWIRGRADFDSLEEEHEFKGREIVQFIEKITGQKIDNNKVENINPEY